MKHPVRSIVIGIILIVIAIAAFYLALSITSETIDWDYNIDNIVIDLSTDKIIDLSNTASSSDAIKYIK